MTNEEIIGQLEWVKKRIRDITYSPESFEAINIAIKVLKKVQEITDIVPTAEPKLSDEKIEKITDLLETEWGYEGIREDVSRILREADNDKVD